MAVSEAKLASMVRLCSDQPYNVQQLAKLLNLGYMELYNFLGTGKGKFYFSSQKIDGIRFFRANPEQHYLINGKAKLKPYQKPQQQAYTKINNNIDLEEIPKRCGPERKKAIRRIRKINGFGKTVEVEIDGESKRIFQYHSSFHKEQYQESLALFFDYIMRIDELELHFEPLEDFFGKPLEKPYTTRFNYLPKQIKLRENYEAAFKGGEDQYTNASFVTLTTDPKKFKNLWSANKHFQKNWNKLITNLRKRTGHLLPYVCVREFQNNGRVHFHVCIFGIHLPETKQNAPYNNPISKIWKRYGQGQITDVKNLIRKDGVMQWDHNRPPDCKKDEPPMKYLKKYLIKAQYDEKAQFQYWIYNARYYTYSQSLHHKPKRRRHKSRFKYVGTMDKSSGIFYRAPDPSNPLSCVVSSFPSGPPVSQALPAG